MVAFYSSLRSQCYLDKIGYHFDFKSWLKIYKRCSYTNYLQQFIWSFPTYQTIQDISILDLTICSQSFLEFAVNFSVVIPKCSPNQFTSGENFFKTVILIFNDRNLNYTMNFLKLSIKLNSPVYSIRSSKFGLVGVATHHYCEKLVFHKTWLRLIWLIPINV